MNKKRVFKKSYKTKKKKKSLSKNKFFLSGILISITLICLFYLFLLSWFFQIEKIEISGNEKIKTQDIENLVKDKINKKILFIPHANIFLANLNNIEQNLFDKFPRINNIYLQKKFPRVLKIEIQEKNAIGIFIPNLDFPQENNESVENNSENIENKKKQDNTGFLIDDQGVIFEKINVDEYNKNNPTGKCFTFIKIKNLIFNEECEIGNAVIDKNIIAEILKISKKMKNNLKIPIVSAEIISKQRLNIKTIEEWEIYFNTQKDIDWQITEISLLLKEKVIPEKRQELKYIDLRFDKIYISPDIQ